MLVQIYEASTPDEARALGDVGVDHIGVLVGDGSFPREHSIDQARAIISAIPSTSKGLALLLSADVPLIEHIISELKPAILHLGASADLLTSSAVQKLKKQHSTLTVMRSIPVIDDESITIAQSYDGIADILLLDSHRPGDAQIGALGMTHSWDLDRKIVQSLRIPVIIAGGLGPENVVEAIRRVRPAGVDSKTKTDKDGSHTKDLQKVKRFVVRAKYRRSYSRFRSNSLITRVPEIVGNFAAVNHPGARLRAWFENRTGDPRSARAADALGTAAAPASYG